MSICCTFNGGGLDLVADAVQQCLDAGGTVLSPIDPTPADLLDDFRFVASDLYRDPVLVERRHLDAVAASDLVWLIAPDGYVGFAAATEIAYAAGRGVPVYTAEDHVAEPAIAALVRHAASPLDALRTVHVERHHPSRSLLLDPHAAAYEAHTALERLREMLQDRSAQHRNTNALADKVRSAVSGL